jgi:hypothetical protein
MKLRFAGLVAGLIALGGAGMTPVLSPPAFAAKPAKPAISKEAAAALIQMGQTLRSSQQFSFKVHTIRVYELGNGPPLHIFHTLTVTVSRPNRLLVDSTGDDGTHKLFFDGKALTIFSPEAKKYASIAAPPGATTIDAMLRYVMTRYGVEMPLADFFSEAPNKAFLTGSTEGQVVGTVMIDGAEYLHLAFWQPPGLELELWVEKDARALPRRLIVTYRRLPGQPEFIALFSDWDFGIHPSAAEFEFHPPPGAVEVPMKPLAEKARKVKGGKR